MYNTEPELGLAIKESGIARDKLYVVTKVMHNIDDIESALDNSLKKLQLDYVDLYVLCCVLHGLSSNSNVVAT